MIFLTFQRPFSTFRINKKGADLVFDETTKSAPYSLLKDFSQRCPLFYLKKGTAWQDLPFNSFLREFKSSQTRRSSQNIFSKLTLFRKQNTTTTWNCRRSAYSSRLLRFSEHRYNSDILTVINNNFSISDCNLLMMSKYIQCMMKSQESP